MSALKTVGKPVGVRMQDGSISTGKSIACHRGMICVLWDDGYGNTWEDADWIMIMKAAR